MGQPEQHVDPAMQAAQRLAFLEVALPQIRQQRDEALDDVIRAKAEHKLHVDFLQGEMAKLEGRVKESQAALQQKQAELDAEKAKHPAEPEPAAEQPEVPVLTDAVNG